MDAIISIATIYIFIVLGFIAKKRFKEQIDEKTLILLSLYFLQPILTFWGLTQAKLSINLLLTPVYYLIAIFITLVFSIFISKKIIKDSKEQSIFIAASLIGNTGNLGIPLGLALFGEASVAYTSIINIANIFFVYTIGIYFYAKEQFDIKGSLKQILTIPILWVAIFALWYNYMEFPINTQMQKFLQMGAYATIVIQLIIFGIYLANIQIKQIDYKFSGKIIAIKHILLPIVGFFVVWYFDVDKFIATILLLELMVPLAVNNVNLSALYNCKPYKTTEVVFVTTLFFILFIYFYLYILGV